MTRYPIIYLLAASVVAVVTAGCGNINGANLFFGQQHTVGIGVSGSATEQAAEITIGYKDRNFAIVPAVVDFEGVDPVIIEGKVGETDPQDRDALSVLGQFEINTSASSNLTAGLGKFFATGLAAQKLADGFKCKLAGDKTCFGDDEEDNGDDDGNT